METIERYMEIANEAIASTRIDKAPERLYEPINYTMKLGGKRLRPTLMMMSCEAFGCHYSMCLNQAVGLEYFHNFTLLHDDVMDNADMRRGMPTVHRKWDVNTAILSGDTMLTLAGQMIVEKKHGAKSRRLVELFNRTAIEVYEGQQYDMDFETRTDVSVDEYINMIRLKTSVLFGCACKMGAIVAGARVADQNSIYDFALNLGLAFQLQDDYLDVFGDPATFGKAIGGDILNAKRTFMLISAYNAANDAQKAELNRLLAIDNPERNAEKIEGVTQLYNELGIPAICRAEIKRYSDLAVRSLDKIAFDRDDRKKFIELVNMLIKRDR